MNLTDDSHVWILPGYSAPDWWNTSDEADGCSDREMKQALQYTLFVDTMGTALHNESAYIVCCQLYYFNKCPILYITILSTLQASVYLMCEVFCRIWNRNDCVCHEDEWHLSKEEISHFFHTHVVNAHDAVITLVEAWRSLHEKNQTNLFVELYSDVKKQPSKYIFQEVKKRLEMSKISSYLIVSLAHPSTCSVSL